MKRRHFLLLFIPITFFSISQYHSITAYLYLFQYDYSRSQNSANGKSFLLKNSLTHAQQAGWIGVSQTAINQHTPRGQHIKKVSLERRSTFPTGQVLLEFLVAESYGSGELKGYQEIVYLELDSNNVYQRVDAYRRFLP